MKKDHFALKNFLKTKIGNKNHFFFEHPEDKSFKWEGTAWDRADARRKAREAYETRGEKKSLKEEMVTAGIPGAGDSGEAFKPSRPIARRGKFMNMETFVVSSSTFNSLRQQKKKGKHWRTYLEEDDAYHDLREYAKKCKGPIIVEDERTGACMYVRYGRGGLQEVFGATNTIEMCVHLKKKKLLLLTW